MFNYPKMLQKIIDKHFYDNSIFCVICVSNLKEINGKSRIFVDDITNKRKIWQALLLFL
jgi:hypothetical protein